MRSFYLTLFLFILHPAVDAGNSTQGQPCSIGNNRLQTGTYQFWNECNSVTFCSSNNICEPKRCRSDDFPFGYVRGVELPQKCPQGQFCPDEGSDCQPVLPVGSPCQLNRDDQCEAPPNFKELVDTSGRGLNFNGSVCLNNVCMWANKTLGSSCTVENTPYIVYGTDGESIDIVSRGDCKLDHYCDSVSRTCMATKSVGTSCSADKECDSLNCLSNGICGVSLSLPRKFPAWVYVLVAFGIIGLMSAIIYGLYRTHHKQRETERAKRQQYWREQSAFHQNLMKMRDTVARISIQSQASDEVHVSALDKFPKAQPRNLRENERDLDDRLARLSRRFDPGRF